MDVNQRNGYSLSRRLKSSKQITESRPQSVGPRDQAFLKPQGSLASLLRFDHAALAGWSMRPSGPALSPVQVRALALVMESVEAFRRKQERERVRRIRRTQELARVAPAHSIRTATEAWSQENLRRRENGDKYCAREVAISEKHLAPREAQPQFYWQECEEIAEFDLDCELSSPEGFVLKVSAHVVLTRRSPQASEVQVELQVGDGKTHAYSVHRHCHPENTRKGSEPPPARGTHFWLG